MPAKFDQVSDLSSFVEDQRKDQAPSEVKLFLKKHVLPADNKRARKVALVRWDVCRCCEFFSHVLSRVSSSCRKWQT